MFLRINTHTHSTLLHSHVKWNFEHHQQTTTTPPSLRQKHGTLSVFRHTGVHTCTIRKHHTSIYVMCVHVASSFAQLNLLFVLEPPSPSRHYTVRGLIKRFWYITYDWQATTVHNDFYKLVFSQLWRILIWICYMIRSPTSADQTNDPHIVLSGWNVCLCGWRLVLVR